MQNPMTKSLWPAFLIFFAGLIFIYWTVDGLLQHQAHVFERSARMFEQSSRPADFVASIVLHFNLGIVLVLAGLFWVSQYFYFDVTKQPTVLIAGMGYAGAVMLMFCANFGPFALVGWPLFMLLGFPVGMALSRIWEGSWLVGFLPPVGHPHHVVSLAYLGGFFAWWFALSLLLFALRLRVRFRGDV